MPLISVIMGVYNCKDFKLLQKSVASVINQTITNWEFIICNDGSTNNTLKELKKIELWDSRIKIISYSRNQGLSFALNSCLKEAKGALIARQDDDDISEPNRFQRQVDFLREHPEYDFVGTNANIFDDNGVWGNYLTPEKPGKKDFLWNNPFIHPSIVIRREALKSIGFYRVAKETRRCEDYDMFMRMYAAGHAGYNIQEHLYNYRMVNDVKKKYRPMRYRIDEAVVRFKGYKRMGILAKGIPFIFKPILLGLMPQCLLYKIKKAQY